MDPVIPAGAARPLIVPEDRIGPSEAYRRKGPAIAPNAGRAPLVRNANSVSAQYLPALAPASAFA